MFNPFPNLPYKVNNYRLNSIIGQNEFTIVYKSTSLTSNTELAIKVFSYSKITKENLAIFEEEMKTLVKLDHPNIVHLFEFFKDDNYFYLVYEYCNGGTLQQKIKGRDEVSYYDKLFICSQIISALKYCNDKSITHQNIKTSNILFNFYGQVKVSDFFFNRIVKHYDSLNQFGGSICYDSPEICKNQYINASKSDIWSLGVLFYRLFSHCYPFEGRSIHEIKGRIVSGFYPDRLNGPIAKIVGKMLSVCPDQRPTLAQLAKMEIFHSFISCENTNESLKQNVSSSSLVKNMILKGNKRRDSCYIPSKPLSFIEPPKTKCIRTYNSHSTFQ